MRHAQILSTGCYIPKKRIDNAEFKACFGENVDDWLVKNVGIRSRHVMADDETTSDLVVNAARQALERSGTRPEELDLIILATDTPDYLSPATSTAVQHKLGATDAGTFDINAACSGFVAALDTAARYVRTDDTMKRVLVCGAYAMTRFLDWNDKHTATLFADGAAAFVVGAADQPGHLAGTLVADGQYHDALGIYSGGAQRPATPDEVNAHGKPRVAFVRKFPPTFNSDRWPPLIQQTLRKAGVELGEVALSVFTQLNARTIETVMGKLELAMDRTHMVMDKWGYLGSACIPAAFHDALETKNIPAGAPIVFCATGGGLAMACSVWRHYRPAK